MENMLMARSLYHWMMKKVSERWLDNARFDLRSKFYTAKPKADHPWLTRRTPVISK
jgi:hypothetical protein